MSDQLFEHAVRDWLEDGSDRTPPTAIKAVLLAVKTTPQDRDLRIPRRLIPMTTYMRLAAGIAIVAIVGVGVLAYINRAPGVGSETQPPPTPSAAPTATPAPSPTISSLIDTTLWTTTYVSDRYGFSIDHPGDWTETVSEHDWTWENDIAAFQSNGVDSFSNPEGSVRASAWSAPVEPGATLESVMEAYCLGQSSGACTGIQDEAVDVGTRDGHPGRLIFGPETDTMAFFLDGQTMYVVAVWRAETDPTVAQYGGARRLLEAFVSTLTLPAESPLGSPSAS